MTIRLRILLLALITMTSVVSALYMQYRAINAEVEALERHSTNIIQARTISSVIHALQIERGLSGSFMVDRSADRRKKLASRQQVTDDVLGKLDMQRQISLLKPVWIVALRDNLTVLREQVNSGDSDWPAVRSIYSKAISDAQDVIITNISLAEQMEQSKIIFAITSLTLARENLGLIRASVSLFLAKERHMSADIGEINRYYGAFLEYKHSFARDLSESNPDALARVFSDVYTSVIKRIEEVTSNTETSLDHKMLNIWWDETTLVIDTMKAVEDSLFDKLTTQITQRIEVKQAGLRNYVLIAFFLTGLIFLFTMLMMSRIFQAMRVLLKTLEKVTSSQDFKTRVLLGTQADEFKEIGLSINHLLSYTDKLISEKDFLANTDLLTNISNRRSFLEGAQKELDRVKRYGGTLGLAVCDIDHFKTINDTYGHDIGDQVLKRLSSLLQNQLRTSDLFGRWGGEEFVILIPHANPDSLRVLSENLRACIQDANICEAGSITCSFGGANSTTDDTFETLFKRADKALYKAKNGGRNRVEIDG